MLRTSLLLLVTALSLPACGTGDTAETKPELAKKPAAPEADAPKEPAADPAPKAPAAQERTVASGLDLGDRFKAFEIVNCDSGEEYCQVCKYGSSPKIMAAGALDDEAFKEDLKNIDAIVAKYGTDKVKAFGVIAESKDGKLGTPVENREALQAKVKELRAELGISMPLVVPAPENGKPNAIWEEHYKVSQSRTLMFADGKNEVKYSAIAPSDLGALDQAIKSVVES